MVAAGTTREGYALLGGQLAAQPPPRGAAPHSQGLFALLFLFAGPVEQEVGVVIATTGAVAFRT
jgi:hypothetical protein